MRVRERCRAHWRRRSAALLFVSGQLAYTEFFPGNKPARSTLQVKNMAGTKTEIEAIAYKHEAD